MSQKEQYAALFTQFSYEVNYLTLKVPLNALFIAFATTNSYICIK
jgi:hypothetical protein